jgi:non-homologous end joining protein Ku
MLELIERKTKSGGRELPAAPTKRDVIDLVAVLKESLAESGRGKRAARSRTTGASRNRSRTARKAAA